MSILYGIILFLTLPLSVWLQLSYQQETAGALWVDTINKLYLPSLLYNPFSLMMNMFIPIVFALTIFHYLHKDRACTFFHSLPIKRSSLYLQNLLAGLLMVWVPIIINGILMYGAFAAFGVNKGEWFQITRSASESAVAYAPYQANIISLPEAFGWWLFITLLMTVLFYVFTVFVGMFTGNVLLQGVLSYIGLFLPLGMYALIKLNLALLVYGFPETMDESYTEWLSPLAAYTSITTSSYSDNYGLYLSIYIFVVLLLSLGALIMYKWRKAEVAGDTLAADWIRFVFKYGVAFCTALTIGLYFIAMVNNNAETILYPGYLAGAVLGYIIADMIAHKSFRFYERWKGLVIFSGIFLLLILGIKMDFIGYEKFLPDAASIDEVRLSILDKNGNSSEKGLSSPDNIEDTIRLQAAIQSRKSENKDDAISSGHPDPKTGVYPNIRSTEITYVLNNGKEIKRSYNIDINKYKKYLEPVVMSEEGKKVLYSQLFELDMNKLDKIDITNFRFNKSSRIYDRDELMTAITALRQDAMNASYEAAMEDSVPIRVNVDLIVAAADKTELNYYTIPVYTGESENFQAFLDRAGYTDILFIDPATVQGITVEKSSGGEKLITSIKDIDYLLNIAYATDEKNYTMHGDIEIAKENNEISYFGKVIMKDKKTYYVDFDASPESLAKLKTISGI